jgi:hypothetical protein
LRNEPGDGLGAERFGVIADQKGLLRQQWSFLWRALVMPSREIKDRNQGAQKDRQGNVDSNGASYRFGFARQQLFLFSEAAGRNSF